MNTDSLAQWIAEEIAAIQREDLKRLAERPEPRPPLAEPANAQSLPHVLSEGLLPFSEAVARLAESAVTHTNRGRKCR